MKQGKGYINTQTKETDSFCVDQNKRYKGRITKGCYFSKNSVLKNHY